MLHREEWDSCEAGPRDVDIWWICPAGIYRYAECRQPSFLMFTAPSSLAPYKEILCALFENLLLCVNGTHMIMVLLSTAKVSSPLRIMCLGQILLGRWCRKRVFYIPSSSTKSVPRSASCLHWISPSGILCQRRPVLR